MSQEGSGAFKTSAILQYITLGLLGWLLTGMVQAKQDIAVMQASVSRIEGALAMTPIVRK